jgi:hypothetical protein
MAVLAAGERPRRTAAATAGVLRYYVNGASCFFTAIVEP